MRRLRKRLIGHYKNVLRRLSVLFFRRDKRLFQTRIDLPPPAVFSPPQTILLIKMDHIGDFVFAMPAFHLVQESFPDAVIDLVCGPWNRALAEASGLFHEVYCETATSEISGQKRYFFNDSHLPPILGQLPAYDLAIDLRVEDEMRQLLDHVAAKVKAAYGSRRVRRDYAIQLPRPHSIRWYAQRTATPMAKMIASLVCEVVLAYKEFGWIADSLKTIGASATTSVLFETNGLADMPLIGINASSGAETRNWPIERYADLCIRLAGHFGARCLLIGAPKDVPMHQALMRLLPAGIALDFTGRTNLPEMVNLTAHLMLFVGNDTGTTHIAAGTGVPTICIYGGVGPYGRFAARGARTTSICHEVPCAPCGRSQLTDCLMGHACMKGILVKDVFETACTLLSA